MSSIIRFFASRVGLSVMVGLACCLSGPAADAGEVDGQACRSCGPCGGAGGTSTPYGDTGCGRRYCGAKHDEPWTPDPCDSCNRWRGCNGAREMPEQLAPWQLPPGRGFRTAADVGYLGNGGGGPCTECWTPWYRLW